MSKLYQITSDYFCAGVVANDKNKIIETAPILHYMLKWDVARVYGYTHRKGWTCILVRENGNAKA